MKIIQSEAYSRKSKVLRLAARLRLSAPIPEPGAPNGDAAQDTRVSETGFSLAETMVACAMLAVMAVSLYGGISFGFSNITLARQNLRGTQIALEKMEITRMYSWDQINSNGFVPVSFTAPYFPSFGTTNPNGGLVYYGTLLITNVNRHPSYSNDMREVRVTLNWTNKTVPQTLQMSTFVSQYGMQRYIY